MKIKTQVKARKVLVNYNESCLVRRLFCCSRKIAPLSQIFADVSGYFRPANCSLRSAI